MELLEDKWNQHAIYSLNANFPWPVGQKYHGAYGCHSDYIYIQVLPNLFICRKAFKELQFILHRGRRKPYKDLEACISNYR
jgi:hypothetical protein